MESLFQEMVNGWVMGYKRQAILVILGAEEKDISEMAKRVREKHQIPKEYQVGASKTMGVPIRKLFNLKDSNQAAKMKAIWIGALKSLKETLEQ